MGERLAEKLQTNNYIIDILDYHSQSSRIQGFQAIWKIGLPGPKPMKVLGHSAFEEYKKDGFTAQIVNPILDAFHQIRKNNPGRGAYIGRAFFVPTLDNPNGPRTASIKTEADYLHEVERFWLYARENHYDIEGADIALVLHPFIHVMDPPRKRYGIMELSEGEILPNTGGYALCSPVPGIPHRVEIRALFGTDEAVQSFPHDTIIVDPDTDTILEKKVAYKEKTFVPRSGSEYAVLEIPPRFCSLQALTDLEALQIAQFMRKTSHIRSEFVVQEDGVFFREIAPYDPAEEYEFCRIKPGECIVGKVLRVNSTEDIGKINPSSSVIYLGPKTFLERKTNLFLQVARAKKESTVFLVHGWNQTSHQARILHDYGHNIIHVGDKQFVNDEQVEVSLGHNGLPEVKTANFYAKAVVDLDAVQELSQDQAGKKVAHLAIMRHAKINVPPGFAVKSEALWKHLEYLKLLPDIHYLEKVDPDDQKLIASLTISIREKIRTSSLHPDFLAVIREAVTATKISSFAVRSSGNEDRHGESMAGIFESYLNVSPGQVPEKLLETFASYFSPQSIIMIRSHGLKMIDAPFGVGVHECILVDPNEPDDISGTIFTFPNKITIETVKGPPGLIVSGTAKNFSRITTDREGVVINTDFFGDPRRCPNLKKDGNGILPQLVSVTLQIENLFRNYQDIEWIRNQKQGLVVLQARPM